MHKLLKKDQILTLPNLLSVIRLMLVPVIIWIYCFKKEYGIAVAVIVVSGVTDIVDGFVARRFNMVSDFGKILDPIADKFTQATVIICLATRYKLMYPLIVLFVIKEIVMATMGFLAIRKKDIVNSAKWYGKLNTVVIYAVMIFLILFPEISDTVSDVLIVGCAVVMLITLLLYIGFYLKLFSRDIPEKQFTHE